MHKNACAQKKSHCRGTGSEAVEKPRGKRERAEVLLRFARLFCQSFRHGLRRVTSRSLRRGLRRATSLFPSGKRRLRVLTKSQKNEALIRNDGVYVISGIFSGANACVCGKKCIPAPTAGRKSPDLQAVGQIRWQTEGLSTISTSLFPSGKRRLLGGATSCWCSTSQKAPLEPKGAHEARALCAKQREVSPMSKGEPQANL